MPDDNGRNLEKAALRGEPSYVWRAGQERRLQMILESGGQRLTGRMLENGCGVGMYVDHLAPYAGMVVGLEIEYERAREAAQRSGSILTSLWHALTGAGTPYESGHDDLMPLAEGTGEGVLRGGCLSLLAAAAGTPWALRPLDEPTILFVEDVDEKPYRIDRMLRQLRASGALQGVTGVVFGDMKGCTPTFHDDYRLEDVLLETLEGLDVPIALGLSSGHTAHPNLTLPLGVRARLECYGTEARFTVLEAPVE